MSRGRRSGKGPGGALRLPAEWEPHEATWLTWPHATGDWPGRFAAIPFVYAEIVRRVSRGERVRVLVNGPAHEARARRLLRRSGVELSPVEFLRIPTDRGWNRDSGPIVLSGGGRRAVAGFRFNAWARYPDFRRDARVAERAARALGLPLRPVLRRGRPVVLEGGAVDVNGRGSILATEECLLDPRVQVRNPGFGKEDYRAVFAEVLGAGNVIWLGSGISGDDTHGHVDDLARFTGPRTIALCRTADPRHPDYRALEENRERLASARLEDGSRPEVVELPVPGPVAHAGRRLPASYANFYVCNAATLVPTFDDPHDRLALGILAGLLPDRPVVGIHALDLVWGLGTLHCLTQQEPAAG